MANASWIDAEALEPDSDDEQTDMWHVVISEGQVKTLTLEQLDDFFRLDVIDVNTKVWGPDMEGWTTLGEALGIEDDDDAEEVSVVTDDFAVANPYDRPTVKQSLPPPPFAPASTAAGRGALPRLVAVPEVTPPRSFTPPKLTPYAAVAIEDYRGDVETVAKAYVPPPRLNPTYPPVNSPHSTQTFGVVSRPVSPYGVSTAPAVPRAPAVPTVPYAPPPSVYPAALEQPGASLRPAAMDIAPPSRGRRDSIRAFASDPDLFVPKPSRFGAWLVAAAVLAGAVVTLYRNDLLRDLAHRAGQDAAYERLEVALGGPAFGTPRSVVAAGMGESALGARSGLPPSSDSIATSAPKAEEARAIDKADEPKADTAAPASANKAVAIDALPPEGAKVVAREAAKPEAAAPVAAASPAKKPLPKAEVPAPAPRAKATATSTRPATKKDAPEPKSAPARAKAVEADEPLPGMPPSLDDAIRDRATRSSKKASSTSAPAAEPKKKKKSAGNDYDPLNSDLYRSKAQPENGIASRKREGEVSPMGLGNGQVATDDSSRDGRARAGVVQDGRREPAFAPALATTKPLRRHEGSACPSCEVQFLSICAPCVFPAGRDFQPVNLLLGFVGGAGGTGARSDLLVVSADAPRRVASRGRAWPPRQRRSLSGTAACAFAERFKA